MSEIVWEDPPDPPQHMRKGKPTMSWGPFVGALQEHPGKWALARKEATTNRSQFSMTRLALLHRGCEAITRTVDGELRLYARWPEEVAS